MIVAMTVPMCGPTYHRPDFRTWPPRPSLDGDGRRVVAVRCEELVGDRWEPFVTFHELG